LCNKIDNISQVDLVEGCKDIKERIQRLRSVKAPELELRDAVSLEVKGELAWLVKRIVFTKCFLSSF